jgi:hypothetical protein
MDVGGVDLLLGHSEIEHASPLARGALALVLALAFVALTPLALVLDV